MCESWTAYQINRISRNASQKKKAVAIAAEKTVSTSATNIVYNHQFGGTTITEWLQPPISGTSSHSNTAATHSLFPFPIHYTLTPRPTLHMLIDLAMCHKTVLSVSISATLRSLHSTLCTEESLHFTPHRGESPLHSKQVLHGV